MKAENWTSRLRTRGTYLVEAPEEVSDTNAVLEDNGFALRGEGKLEEKDSVRSDVPSERKAPCSRPQRAGDERKATSACWRVAYLGDCLVGFAGRHLSPSSLDSVNSSQ